MSPERSSRDAKAGVGGAGLRIIDEDPAMRRLLCRELGAAGYRVEGAAPGGGAPGLDAQPVDLVILDFDARAGGGAEAIRALRALSPVPILVLSTRVDEDAMVEALAAGADDFVRKPFGTKELLARVENALRRRAREEGRAAQVVSGDVRIDLLRRRVRVRGREVHVPQRCWEVLRLLAERPGEVLTREELLSAVWGPERADRLDYLRIAIQELRRRMEADPTRPVHILTEAGVGYRLDGTAAAG